MKSILDFSFFDVPLLTCQISYDLSINDFCLIYLISYLLPFMKLKSLKFLFLLIPFLISFISLIILMLFLIIILILFFLQLNINLYLFIVIIKHFENHFLKNKSQTHHLFKVLIICFLNR